MASTYDLELLEDLICVTLNPKAILQQQATATQIAEWEMLAQTENSRIRKRMKATVANPGKDKDKARYVQRNQRDIIVLKNTIVNYLLPKTFKELDLRHDDEPLIRIFKVLFHTLKGLLEYIEEFFKPYFNLDENIPESYQMRSQHFLKDKLSILKKKVNKHELDSKLTEMVFSPIEVFCTTKEKTITYRNFLYIKKLSKQMETFAYAIETFPEGTRNKKLIELLYYLNFNSTLFINYLITDMIATVNLYPEVHERTEKLAQYFKDYNQLPLKPGLAYKPQLQNIKEQLTTWISEELYYLEQKQRLLFVVPLKNEAELPDEEKIHFSTSVEVLTLLAKAAKDSKLILNQQNTLMYKSLVRFVRTARTHTISANSLLKKGYVAERSAKKTAINILHEMISHIHKY